MEIKASLKYVRVGAQKARLVADLVRGHTVNDAVSLLTFSKKKSAHIMKQLIQSAAANAEFAKVIDVDNLYIKKVYVNQAPHLKRFLPTARGRSSRRNKKQSHMHIVLGEK